MNLAFSVKCKTMKNQTYKHFFLDNHKWPMIKIEPDNLRKINLSKVRTENNS